MYFLFCSPHTSTPRTGSKLGISPLMLAAMNGHTAAVKLLLDMGSDINAQIETNRNTALTLACFQGRTEVVSLLLDRKANVEHRAKVRKHSKFVHGFIGLIFKVSSSNMLNIVLVSASNIYHSVEHIQTLTLENTSKINFRGNNDVRITSRKYVPL